jgi:putative phage-type endonuclease
MENVERVLGSAAPSQNTPEWLMWRREHLTASDAHKITGDAVKTRQTLLDEKSGARTSFFFGNEFTESGHANEEVAIRKYEELYSTRVHTNLSPVEHPVHSRLAASLDGMTEDGKVVEVKCVHAFVSLKKPKSQHVQQVQFQMACSGLEEAIILYYYPNILGRDGDPMMDVYDIKRDEEWWNAKLPKFLKFIDDLDVAIVDNGFDIVQLWSDDVEEDDYFYFPDDYADLEFATSDWDFFPYYG